jgi:hypothetical protein
MVLALSRGLALAVAVGTLVLLLAGETRSSDAVARIDPILTARLPGRKAMHYSPP